jgi:serine protease AprX
MSPARVTTVLPSRNIAALLVLALVAVPTSGCLDVTSASRNGYGENWTLKLVQADTLHDRGLTGKGVRIAIIDTGIDASHSEFDGVPIEWADLVAHRSQPYDDNGHGTHVAGIIAAQGTWGTVFSGFRLKGVAPDATLIVIKAMDADGNGDESRVATGITTAVNANASIIVLSLGGKTQAIFGTNTEAAVKSAIQRGVFVVAAAGNADKKTGETDCTITSPASVAGVIAVGAIDKRSVIADFSCRGTGKEGNGSILPGIPSPVTNDQPPDEKPEVVAPGVEVLSSWLGGGYAIASGTSQAAPIVGGILALLLQSKPQLARQSQSTVEDVKEKLMASSKKIGPLSATNPASHDDRYGYGLVQGEALVRAMS